MRPLGIAQAFALGFLCLSTAPAAAQGAAAPPAAGRAGPEAEITHATVPVVLDGETLFRVRGSPVYAAVERARLISGRIAEAARTRDIAPEAVLAVPSEDVIDVNAGDRFLMVVTDADARLEGVDRRVLARAYVERIQRGLRTYRQAREPEVLLRGAWQALAATAIFLVALLGLGWTSRRLKARHVRRYEEKVQSVRFQKFEILQARHIKRALWATVRVVRGAATGVLAYLWLQFVLNSFPTTRPLAARLLSLVLEPVSRLVGGLVAHIPDLAFLLVLYLVTRWLLRLTRLFFDAVERGGVVLSGFDAEWAIPTYRIVRVVAVAFALVVAYPSIPGSRSAAFQGMSIFLGVMFSIGSSSFIANIIAGYSMTYRRAFRLGDRIRVGEIFGDVTEIRLQVTNVRSLRNEEIVVPNSTLLNSNVVNYSALARSSGLILHTTVGIGYETPWRQVETMLLLAAERTPGLAPEPAPFVLQMSLGDFCVVYEINVYCDTPARMEPLYTALHQNILDVFNEYGVQIMTPAYEGDTEQAKLVPKEQWWSAPARPTVERPPVT
ncbi:MAG TPA: mechanosensitive ion channel domain-containing protein [Vicinamibacteria bacterium]|nr:mechanosensitive ion channel domain-containing protein [Vicinamibacteria bacterium]